MGSEICSLSFRLGFCPNRILKPELTTTADVLADMLYMKGPPRQFGGPNYQLIWQE